MHSPGYIERGVTWVCEVPVLERTRGAMKRAQQQEVPVGSQESPSLVKHQILPPPRRAQPLLLLSRSNPPH